MTLPLLMLTAALSLGTYLVGGVPFGLLLGKLKGIDVRKEGSGNIGAANVGRLLGARWGLSVFLLDLLKGLIPATIVGRVLMAGHGAGGTLAAVPLLCWLFAAACAVLGHNHSPFLRFRGGKGVSTSLGVALGIYPDLTYPALLALVVWAVAVGLTRMTSVGSLLAAVMFPVFYLLLSFRTPGVAAQRWPFLLFCLLVGALVVIRHRANISRILSGTEARLGRPRGD